MNAWVLSLIMCAATPQTDGGYCDAVALRFAISREECQAEKATWSRHLSQMRLECTEDPALSAALEEQDGEELGDGQRQANLADPTNTPWRMTMTQRMAR